MKTKRISRLFVVAFMCLLFTSCEDVSKNPLSDPEKSQADHRLEGKWKEKLDSGAGLLQVVPVGGKLDNFLMEYVEPGKVPKDDEKSTIAKDEKTNERILFFTTIIGERHFLNAFVVKEKQFQQLKEQGWKPELIDGYYLYRYKIEDDKLILQQISADVKRKAIESGKIKGVIDKRRYANDHFTDTMENVNQFYGSLDDKQFEDFMIFKKVK